MRAKPRTIDEYLAGLKGAIRFPPDAVPPPALIRRLVKARIAEAFPGPSPAKARSRA